MYNGLLPQSGNGIWNRLDVRKLGKKKFSIAEAIIKNLRSYLR